MGIDGLRPADPSNKDVLNKLYAKVKTTKNGRVITLKYGEPTKLQGIRSKLTSSNYVYGWDNILKIKGLDLSKDEDVSNIKFKDLTEEQLAVVTRTLNKMRFEVRPNQLQETIDQAPFKEAKSLKEKVLKKYPSDDVKILEEPHSTKDLIKFYEDSSDDKLKEYCLHSLKETLKENPALSLPLLAKVKDPVLKEIIVKAFLQWARTEENTEYKKQLFAQFSEGVEFKEPAVRLELHLLQIIPLQKVERSLIDEIKQKAINGSSHDQYLLGKLYESAQSGFPYDEEQSIRWYEKAAEKHDPSALHALGECYQYGRGNLKKDLDKAKELFRKSKDLGFTPALFSLGMVEDDNKAIRLAALKGYVPALLEYGIRNPLVLAKNAFEKASLKWNSEAMRKLADLMPDKVLIYDAMATKYEVPPSSQESQLLQELKNCDSLEKLEKLVQNFPTQVLEKHNTVIINKFSKFFNPNRLKVLSKLIGISPLFVFNLIKDKISFDDYYPHIKEKFNALLEQLSEQEVKILSEKQNLYGLKGMMVRADLVSFERILKRTPLEVLNKIGADFIFEQMEKFPVSKEALKEKNPQFAKMMASLLTESISKKLLQLDANRTMQFAIDRGFPLFNHPQKDKKEAAQNFLVEILPYFETVKDLPGFKDYFLKAYQVAGSFNLEVALKAIELDQSIIDTLPLDLQQKMLFSLMNVKVPNPITLKEIKSAYRKWTLTNHPDKAVNFNQEHYNKVSGLYEKISKALS